MFDCGISRAAYELSNQIMAQEENTIVRVVQEAGYSINKEQLTKALTDARSFYDQGYDEGYDKGYKNAYGEMYNILNANYRSYTGMSITELEQE